MLRLPARLLAFGCALACAGAAHAQSPPTWLFTSDIHLNALADPALADRLAAAPVAQWNAIFDADSRPIAPHGKDTNAPLLRLALAAMQAADPDPDVVVVSGDFLAHTYRGQWDLAASDRSEAAFDAFADKTIAYLAAEFDATFPRAQFIIALGNNDSPCGDYAADPRSAFLAHFAKAWEPLVDRGGRAPDFAREFPVDGDYVAQFAGGTRIIVVDSNAWSPLAADTCDPGGTARSDVIAWFEHAVAAAPMGAKTWAVLHIPPGIDAYSAARANLPIPLYRPDMLARFRAARAADGKPLGLIVAGHLHNDGFRIVDRTPLLLVPSISPIHGNNPAFFVAHVIAPSGTIADYQAYALDENSAPPAAAKFEPEYDFDTSYGVHGFTLDALAHIERSIHDDGEFRRVEAAHYVAGSSVEAIDDRTWRTYWCANAALDPGPFEDCMSGS